MAETTREERVRERVAFWLFMPLAFAFVLCGACSAGWAMLQSSGLVGPSIADFQKYVESQQRDNNLRLTLNQVSIEQAGKRDMALRGSLQMVDEFASRRLEGF
ncbi:hypothetical protein FSY59_08325 [Comamonas sp. Z3]|uniref:hypothetical protein n=1 Tax=Comamonas sp. Z3 TaxID=2601247 RepID=UPI0011E7A45D|nr:hypothetical protein [Comamonas sp. Z3]TYK72791.1 hypothetical protein FSY59_08325 [Comamonas sp. Z3]